MSIWRQLFGPSKEEIWRQLSHELCGDFQEGGVWGVDRVQVRHEDWVITLDHYTVSTGKSSVTYTRMRAPFVNPSLFRFTVYRANIFTGLGKLFGMQDIEVGNPFFDDAFVIQGNQPERVRSLFQNPRLVDLIMPHPQFHLAVMDDEGWFGARFPDGVDQLWFQVVGIIKDLVLLRLLFDTFITVLNTLHAQDSGGADECSRMIETLLGPRGQVVSGGVVMWDGDPGRRKACEALSRSTDPRAVAALSAVVDDGDEFVRLGAIHGLGRMGNVQAAYALIPLLGDESSIRGHMIRQAAAQSLVSLGEGRVSEAYEEILRSGPGGHEKLLSGGYRDALIGAFRRSLRSHFPFATGNSALALSAMGALEALDDIKRRRRNVPADWASARSALDRAIDELDRHLTLPRPAAAPSEDPTHLPIPSAAPGPAR